MNNYLLTIITEKLILNLTGFNTENVEKMNTMFYQSDVTNVIGLDSFDTSNVTNIHEMFSSSKIEYVDLSSFNMDNVTDMGAMFRVALLRNQVVS